MHLQPAVKKEAVHIASGVAILSFIMNIIFAVLGYWDLTVLAGTILGGLFATFNFISLGITVQRVAERYTEFGTKAKLTMQLSYSIRMFITFAVAVIGFTLPYFNGIALLFTLVFPRITILYMGFRKGGKKEESK